MYIAKKFENSNVPIDDLISIGTIGCIKDSSYWDLYQKGLDEMIERLEPKIILVYGRSPDKFFKKYKDKGIIIHQYESQTSLAFRKKELE